MVFCFGPHGLGQIFLYLTTWPFSPRTCSRDLARAASVVLPRTCLKPVYLLLIVCIRQQVKMRHTNLQKRYKRQQEMMGGSSRTIPVELIYTRNERRLGREEKKTPSPWSAIVHCSVFFKGVCSHHVTRSLGVTAAASITSWPGGLPC